MMEVERKKREKDKEIWELIREKEEIAKEASDQLAKLEKEKDKQLADKEKEIAEKDQELAEANTKGNNLLEQLTTFEKNQKEKLAEAQDKSRVGILSIQAGIAETQNLKKDIEIAQLEQTILSITNGKNARLREKETELNSKNHEIEFITNSKNHEIETWTIKYDTEKYENQQNHKEILKKMLEIRGKDNEIIDLKAKINELPKLQAENQNLKEIVSTNNSPFHEFWLIGMGMVISLIIFGLYRIATKILKLPGASSAEKIKKGKKKLRNSPTKPNQRR